MHISPNVGSTTSILFDLKPALDGYAGIPQETRLLFRGLRSLSSCDVTGLIQHGARRLRSGANAARSPNPRAYLINCSSRVVVSLRDMSPASPGVGDVQVLATGAKSANSNVSLKSVLESMGLFLLLQSAQLGDRLGRRLEPAPFAAELFDDFVWRTFFSKTLKSRDKPLVTTSRFQTLSVSRKRLHQVGLAGRRWSRTPRYLSINTHGSDVLLAQTPFPARVSGGTQLVIRYHDAIPIFLPHTINDSVFHQASHYYALQENVRAGAWFSCVSESTRRDLLTVFPEAEARTSVIHNMISDDYFDEFSAFDDVPQIIRSRLVRSRAVTADLSSLESALRGSGTGFDYLLMVSTIEPRKNHLLLIAAWERLKYNAMPRLKLVVVGSPGWASASVLDAFRPWLERGEIFYLNNVPSAELRVLYRHAAATICPSLAEGFDYSGIEAMRSGGVVIASGIPVHREIYGDASAYFDPYSAEDAAAVIGNVLSDESLGLREQLRVAGARAAARYTSEHLLSQWEGFFHELKKY
jgi:hypothetical protein